MCVSLLKCSKSNKKKYIQTYEFNVIMYYNSGDVNCFIVLKLIIIIVNY